MKVDGVSYLDLDDIARMEREARLADELGFSGKGSIHPKQMPVLNRVFSPDAASILYAQNIVAAFAEADTGLIVVEGKLIEKPVLREMNRILAIGSRIRQLLRTIQSATCWQG